MAAAHMVTLDRAENISLLRISVRFMDMASIYFIRENISFVVLQVQVQLLAHEGFGASHLPESLFLCLPIYIKGQENALHRLQ